MTRINIDKLISLLVSYHENKRHIVAIAGAPAAGKSTIAAAMVDEINKSRPTRAVLLPMDGFHYDDELLGVLERKARKGAPDTFDVDGLRHLLIRLRENTDETIAVPVFDRKLEIARAGARLIPKTSDLIIVEGNYLLLNHPPWSALAPFFDITVMIEVDEHILRQRLEKRWRDLGLEPAKIRRKIDENDLPNGRLVMQRSRESDYLVK